MKDYGKFFETIIALAEEAQHEIIAADHPDRVSFGHYKKILDFTDSYRDIHVDDIRRLAEELVGLDGKDPASSKRVSEILPELYDKLGYVRATGVITERQLAVADHDLYDLGQLTKEPWDWRMMRMWYQSFRRNLSL